MRRGRRCCVGRSSVLIDFLCSTVSAIMLSRTASTILRRSAARYMSTEAAASTSMTLNFSLPHETIYDGAILFLDLKENMESLSITYQLSHSLSQVSFRFFMRTVKQKSTFVREALPLPIQTLSRYVLILKCMIVLIIV